MNNCLFCKIISGEIPSIKVWEDQNYLAILDLNPNTEGMTLVMPKAHSDSYMFDMADKDISEFVLATKKVSEKIENGLGVARVAMVMEGMGINHVHIKLYPLHGLEEKFTEMWSAEKVFFDHYEGYITTQLGPEKSQEELEKVAKKIRSADL
jgi:diadenosine tetraphosphate (Ap4A) HIT family hydrolase